MRAHDFLHKFEEVTKEPYLYLIVDLKPETREWRRLCTNVFGGKDGGGGGGVEEEDVEEEEEMAEEEEELEEKDEEEEEEHPDLLACRPCGLVFAHA